MSWGKSGFLFAFLLFFLLFSLNVSAYEFDYFSTTSSQSPINNSGIYYLIDYDGNCSIVTSNYITTTSSVYPYHVLSEFYNNENLLGTIESDFYSNKNCMLFGNFTASLLDNQAFITRIRTYFDSSSMIQTKKDKIICNNLTEKIIINSTAPYKANGYYLRKVSMPPYYMGRTAILNEFYLKNNDFCRYDTSYPVYFAPIPLIRNIPGGQTGFINEVGFFYPFNSGSGSVNLTIIKNLLATAFVELYKIGEFNPTASLSNGFHQLNLEENTDYVLFIYLFTGSGDPNWNLPTPEVTIEIDTKLPNWKCGEWGECINGSQFRECVDLNGIKPNKLEYQYCYSLPEASVNLGFEDYYATNVWYNYIGFFCMCDSETKQVLYPDGWYINNALFKIQNKNNKTARLYDFIKMTTETSAEGDKSLKMWNLPSQIRIPDVSGYNSIEGFSYQNLIAKNYTDVSGFENISYMLIDDSGVSIAHANGYATLFNFDDLNYGNENNEIRNFSVRIDAYLPNQEEQIDIECVKLIINGVESSCKPLDVSGTNEKTYYVDFTSFILLFHITEIKNISVYIKMENEGNYLYVDFLNLYVQLYNPMEIIHFYDDITCSNLTQGIYPDLYKDITTNASKSIFVEKNITLPSPYVSIAFKVKRCLEPEMKFGANPYCLEFDNHYYTSDETKQTPKGRITFYLKNALTNELLYDFTSNVEYPNVWEHREYAIDNLQPNSVYTFGFAVMPESATDNNYYCVYIDDVNVNFRSSPLVCKNECKGATEIKRTCKAYDNFGNCISCQEETIEVSKNCLSQSSTKNKVNVCGSWCGCEEWKNKNNTNYYTFYSGSILEGCNITTEGYEKCCVYEEIENSDYCLNYCSAQQLSEPTLDVNEVITKLSPFISPMFLIVFIILGIGAFLSYKIKSWQVFAIVLIVGFFIAGMIWVELSFISIIIILIIAYLLAKEFRNP